MIANPIISVNKLAEYITSKGARQRQILYARKYPDEDFSIGMYHKEAAEAICKYLADGAVDQSHLVTRHGVLSQMTPEKIGTARRINSNIDTIERFQDMLDDINLSGAEPMLGPHNPPKMTMHNVQISVRPEIILRSTDNKKRKLVGAIKFHFSSSRPMTSEGAGYVSAVLQEYCKTYVSKEDEIVNPAYCYVIDTASKQIYPGAKATAQRLKDLAAECENIRALWPSI